MGFKSAAAVFQADPITLRSDQLFAGFDQPVAADFIGFEAFEQDLIGLIEPYIRIGQ